MTKLVLFPVRFMFTAATGRVGANDEAVGWYLALDHASAKPLVGAALRWRANEPEDDAVAAGLLRAHLLPLYREYIDDHLDRLVGANEDELANAFERWRERLTAQSGP